jgi:hypothetical protein
MKLITLFALLLITTIAYPQTERFVDLYNQGHITTSELENLIMSNIYKPDTINKLSISVHQPNYILTNFSQSTYGTSAVSPAVWKYLKDFWGFISKTIFYKNPDCDSSIKDCKDLIQEFLKLNNQIKSGN